jgi:hypothetical protein
MKECYWALIEAEIRFIDLEVAHCHKCPMGASGVVVPLAELLLLNLF